MTFPACDGKRHLVQHILLCHHGTEWSLREEEVLGSLPHSRKGGAVWEREKGGKKTARRMGAKGDLEEAHVKKFLGLKLVPGTWGTWKETFETWVRGPWGRLTVTVLSRFWICSFPSKLTWLLLPLSYGSPSKGA